MGYILGLSYNYHDAAAALLDDGAIVAASTEERHTRRKHDPEFPENAIAACLDRAGIGTKDIGWVAFYEQPLVKFERILNMSLHSWTRGGRQFLRSTVEGWAAQAKFDTREQISHSLGLPPERVRFCDHHLSHAASAFYCSPFEAATIVTLDAVGEWDTCTISVGRREAIRRLESVKLPHSLGLFYSALTAFLGFEVNEGEYKVMGMAGFGEPRYKNELLSWFDLRPNGGFRVKHRLLEFSSDKQLTYPSLLTKVFGPPRQPDSPFIIDSESFGPGTARHYADVAASVQAVTEIVIEHTAKEALRRTGVPALCLAGGVALNSAANKRLRSSLAVPMFVQPAAGDAGGALGAAKWLYHCEQRGRNRHSMSSVALGTVVSRASIEAELRRHYEPNDWVEYSDDEALCHAVACLLKRGEVVGWVQGASEWGPRSLGHRSILANPCTAEMQMIVNEKIKFREPFRPFAPSVPAEHARRFFELIDIQGEDLETNPYNFMLAIAQVRSDAASKIPAVVHVDGTARVHTVRRETNPLFHKLLEAFGERTGVPVLLNTSFNLRGEPIVDNAEDAIKTFEWSGMEALAMGRFLIHK